MSAAASWGPWYLKRVLGVNGNCEMRGGNSEKLFIFFFFFLMGAIF